MAEGNRRARPGSQAASGAELGDPRPADAKGIGVFATEYIEAGTTVAAFGGLVVDGAELRALGERVCAHALQIDTDLFLASVPPFDAADYVNHSCDPNCEAIIEGDTGHYIALEFIEGGSLRDIVNGTPLPTPHAFAVMHGLLQALDYAHQHAIVHRDVKPENVMLSNKGEVKVADFGIARLTDDSGAGSTVTKTGTTVGTPQYMSPEQVASSKVDGRSDLYSAGIMFYELVVGQPPFTASEADGPFTLMAKHVQAPPKPPSVYRPGLDMGLEEVILKSLSKRPEERYQSGQEFDDAMSRVADRLCPGWQRSLLPGADLAKMVPGGAPLPGATQAVAGMPVMPASPMPAQPVQSVYNPTPPVRPVAKKSAGCLGVIAGALGLVPLLWALAVALLH